MENIHLNQENSTSDSNKRRQNFWYLHEQRAFLERTFDCSWVASLDGHFYDGFYLSDLRRTIANAPHSNTAHIEHIHPNVNPIIGASHNIVAPRPSK